MNVHDTDTAVRIITLTEALRDAISLIDKLAEQQAMDDDWFKPWRQELLDIAYEGIESSLRPR